MLFLQKNKLVPGFFFVFPHRQAFCFCYSISAGILFLFFGTFVGPQAFEAARGALVASWKTHIYISHSQERNLRSSSCAQQRPRAQLEPRITAKVTRLCFPAAAIPPIPLIQLFKERIEILLDGARGGQNPSAPNDVTLFTHCPSITSALHALVIAS